ncbi:hypothetical protein [Erysipelothrix sp. strain 2 (EsS2-6-Brazil)]|uniref:hypothetical protein n=1 Tax=Erysipelothrix sp. strain 2 (EsS2-6-Brazil) TaxID=2500549 RepID=UPI00190BA2D7|nr:hypothetical protein [Erysipelothrix sp. strain 2 (EsS2-6-Brazil)]MBK2401734.1 hypothetical protein [Erysipelothrix sp. strain 2 (EsS2-6-Brazil)]
MKRKFNPADFNYESTSADDFVNSWNNLKKSQELKDFLLEIDMKELYDSIKNETTRSGYSDAKKINRISFSIDSQEFLKNSDFDVIDKYSIKIDKSQKIKIDKSFLEDFTFNRFILDNDIQVGSKYEGIKDIYKSRIANVLNPFKSVENEIVNKQVMDNKTYNPDLNSGYLSAQC